MRHADLTRCAGDTCAWKNDGGHVLASPLADVLLANQHDGSEDGVMTVPVAEFVKETVEVVTEYLADDELIGALQDVVLAAEGDSNDDEIAALQNALSILTARLGVDWPDREEIDDGSSASRQFRIDTGRYMTLDETQATLALDGA